MTTESIEIEGFDELIGFLNRINSDSRKAILQGQNKTLVRGKKITIDKVSKKITAKKKRIQKDVRYIKANEDNLTGEIKVSSTPLGLINFQPRVLKKGVSVKMYRSGSRKKIPGAYKQKKGGAKNIWRRDYRVGKKSISKSKVKKWGKNIPKQYRLPTMVLKGTRIATEVEKPEILKPIQDEVSELMIKSIMENFDRDILI